MNHWRLAADVLLPDMIELRRAIHAEPELGLDTPLTTRKTKDALKGLPLEIREGGATTGFVAVLHGSKPGRSVLLRADMDALPLSEETGLPFSSRHDRVMHACGHDAHVAMLVGAARALAARRERLSGTVHFMFQPGEEGWHGARHMLDDGLIDPATDAAFALHVTPNMPSGVFAGRAGPMLAAADRFEITVIGRGGHASQPQDAVDPMPVAFEIGGALHAMITRRIPAFDPVVLTVGRISAGHACNIIPEKATMEGSIRSFSESSRQLVHDGLRRLASHICAAHICEAHVDIEKMFPVTICAEEAATLARRVTRNVFGPENWTDMPTPVMGAEDFSYVLERIPGAMVFLGASPVGGDWKTCCSLHSNRMILDESVMARGTALHCAFAETFLLEGFAESTPS